MKPGDYVKLPNGDRGFVLETRGEMALVLGDWDTPLPVAVKVADLESAEAEMWTAEDGERLREVAVTTLIAPETLTTFGARGMARLSLRLLASLSNVDLSEWIGDEPVSALTTAKINLRTVAEALDLANLSTWDITALSQGLAAGVKDALKRAAEPGWATANKARGILVECAPFVGLTINACPSGVIEMATLLRSRLQEMADEAGKNEARAEMTERDLQGEGKALDDALRRMAELETQLAETEASRQAEEDDATDARERFKTVDFVRRIQSVRFTALQRMLDQPNTTPEERRAFVHAIDPRLGENAESIAKDLDGIEGQRQKHMEILRAEIAKLSDTVHRRNAESDEMARRLAAANEQVDRLQAALDERDGDREDNGPPGSEVDLPESPLVTITDGPHKGKRGRVVGPSKFATYARIRFESGSEDDVLRKFVEPKSALPAVGEKPERKKAEPIEVSNDTLDRVLAALAGGPKRKGEIVAATGLHEAVVARALDEHAHWERVVRPTKPGKAAKWAIKAEGVKEEEHVS